MRGNSYLISLARAITNDDPARQARCQPVWDEIAANDGDEHGDYTPFWHERDYLKDAGNITASVFLVHGMQDENVRPDHFSKYWQALKEHDIPRKLWAVASVTSSPSTSGAPSGWIPFTAGSTSGSTESTTGSRRSRE
jgi:hypothetical protein